MNVTSIAFPTPNVSSAVVKDASTSQASTQLIVSDSGTTFKGSRALYIRSDALRDAGHVMTNIIKGTATIEAIVKKERPDLSKVDWDFSVKDRKLAVNSKDMSEQDKDWLTAKLNESDSLVGAANAFVDSAVTYLQVSSDNPPMDSQNRYTGGDVTENFHNVGSQIGDLIGFKALVSEVQKKTTGPNTFTPDENKASMAVDYVAANIKSTNLSEYSTNALN